MAFLQSGPARQPALRAPAIVLWLIALLAAAHAGRMALSQEASDGVILAYAFIPARYTFAGSFWDQAVPFVSYMALHGDWAHLLINCLWLLAFGPIVTRRFGTPLFLLFFLICGVAAALTHLVLNWGGMDPVVGASGAISGLMAAGLRLLPGMFPWATPGETRMAPIFSRQILTFSASWVILNIVVGLVGAGFLGSEGAIAWQAHLGGYLAGLFLSGPFDALRPRPLAPPLSEG
jgi:membrane associated rhomboid family serine protease